MRCAMRCVHTVSPSCCCLGGMSWFVSARSLVRWWRKLWQAGTADRLGRFSFPWLLPLFLFVCVCVCAVCVSQLFSCAGYSSGEFAFLAQQKFIRYVR